jgi:hypothetical protein
MTEQLREIVSAYFLINNEEPVIFSTDEDKINEIIRIASKNNISLKKRKITSNKDRVMEIGTNFFRRNTPTDAKKDPIKFRNLLVKDWHDTVDRLSDMIKVDAKISWSKICKKHNLEDCTVEEFSRWMLDIHEFIKN